VLHGAEQREGRDPEDGRSFIHLRVHLPEAFFPSDPIGSISDDPRNPLLSRGNRCAGGLLQRHGR
jgi:hypothetical protein